MIDNREIYNRTIERLKDNGVCVKDEFSVVVALAKEIGEYREKIEAMEYRIENLLKLNQEEREKNKMLSDRNRELSEALKEWDETGCECPCELEESEISENETFISIESHRKVSNIEIYFDGE